MKTKDTENPLESIDAAISFSPRDWSSHHRDAWIYGIVCGWDSESMKELADEYRWTHETTARLRRLHAGYTALKKVVETEANND